MMTLSIQDLSAGSSRFPRPDDRAEPDCRSNVDSSPSLMFLISTQLLKRFLPKRSVERTEGTKRGKFFHSVSCQDTLKDRIKHFQFVTQGVTNWDEVDSEDFSHRALQSKMQSCGSDYSAQ
ncbi:hypothetical protein [Terracidiphilus sp.]|jgi:hypothetical protein|uniref:hypothetical protein n=1 Tax=Terracidiphilus sp. TaxID=1964191 RepID=UPI003C1D7C56